MVRNAFFFRKTCVPLFISTMWQPAQYRCMTFRKFSLDVSPANRYCGLVCKDIVDIHHIAYQRNIREMVIVGRYFRTQVDFYEYPLPSSHLEIYHVSDLSELRSWPITAVCRKYICIPFKQDHVAFPTLHTLRDRYLVTIHGTQTCCKQDCTRPEKIKLKYFCCLGCITLGRPRLIVAVVSSTFWFPFP